MAVRRRTVAELIEMLEECDPEDLVGAFSSYNDGGIYLRVAQRDGYVAIIGHDNDRYPS